MKKTDTFKNIIDKAHKIVSLKRKNNRQSKQILSETCFIKMPKKLLCTGSNSCNCPLCNN